MAAGANDKFAKVINGTTRPVATTLSAQKLSGATSCTVVATTGWDTDTAVHGIMYRTGADGSKTAGSQIDWKGTISGTTISNFQVTAGSDDTYAIGTTVELSPTAAWADDLVSGILVEHDQDGTHGAVTASSVIATTGTFTNLTVSGTATSAGWALQGAAPTAISYNGNRSYNLTWASSIIPTKSVGYRGKYTRTVTAPTQCADLESSSSQYFNDTTVSGMTFTDDGVVSAHIKMESYPSSVGTIASRYNGTSGWRFWVDSAGLLNLTGFNAGAANFSRVVSYQSVPLNKWIHVAAQLDMSAFTATSTTSYIMFDGVDVPVQVTRGGTNPTALIQAGNLEIGSANGTEFFDGKIAQVAIYSAKVTQANIRATISQTLTGAETSLVSAYTLSNSLTDLVVANANNLTAQGGALATNTDSPFAGGDTLYNTDGTTEFSITTNISTDGLTETVQVPEGFALPTTGGVSAVSYSNDKIPYGFPSEEGRWAIEVLILSNISASGLVANTIYNPGGINLSVPIGRWKLQGAISKATQPSGSSVSTTTALSTSASSYSNLKLVDFFFLNGIGAGSVNVHAVNINDTIVTDVTTPYYALVLSTVTGASAEAIRGQVSAIAPEVSKITATCALL